MNPYPLELFHRQGPSPQKTLETLLELRRTMGVTRIGDVTGLDRIGIPVVQVTRPHSLSNAVSQGKGSDITSAAISAILECAETFVAEKPEHFEITIGSAQQLKIRTEAFRIYLRDDAPSDWQERENAWVTGKNLLDGKEELVPFELVHTAWQVPPLPHDGVFSANTSGLAAGLNLPDAITHGVLECIERDAIERAKNTHGFFHRYRIDQNKIDNEKLLSLFGKLHEKELLIGLWFAPSPVNIPVVWCHLMGREGGEADLLPFPAEGSAASPDRYAAIYHAIVEAAQARVAVISGAREDITRRFYPKYPDWDGIAAHRKLLARGDRTIHYSTTHEHAWCGSRDQLDQILDLLSQAGVTSVLLVHPRTHALSNVIVAKVLIPQFFTPHD